MFDYLTIWPKCLAFIYPSKGSTESVRPWGVPKTGRHLWGSRFATPLLFAMENQRIDSVQWFDGVANHHPKSKRREDDNKLTLQISALGKRRDKQGERIVHSGQNRNIIFINESSLIFDDWTISRLDDRRWREEEAALR